MALVNILLCADRRLLYDKQTIEYLWLALHNSVNFTSKESDDINYFYKFPFPFSVPAPVSIFLEFQLPNNKLLT